MDLLEKKGVIRVLEDYGVQMRENVPWDEEIIENKAFIENQRAKTPKREEVP